MNIGSISQKIFRTKTNATESNSCQTNPFGVNFKGSIINADVFEAKKADLNKSESKNIFFGSALVGSINSFNEAMVRRLNSVVSFGRRSRDTITNWWAKANEINVGEFLSSAMPSFKGTYSVNNLTKRPVSELEQMLSDEVASLQV